MVEHAFRYAPCARLVAAFALRTCSSLPRGGACVSLCTVRTPGRCVCSAYLFFSAACAKRARASAAVRAAGGQGGGSPDLPAEARGAAAGVNLDSPCGPARVNLATPNNTFVKKVVQYRSNEQCLVLKSKSRNNKQCFAQ